MNEHARGLKGARIGFLATAIALYGGLWIYCRITGASLERLSTGATFLAFLLCPLETAVGYVVGRWRGRLFAEIILAIDVVVLLAGLAFMIWLEIRQ